MKKITLLFSLLLVFGLSKAQYLGINSDTIRFSNMPQRGDQVIFVNLFGSDTFEPGEGGESMIWDYTNFVEYPDSLEHFNYTDTTGLPHVPVSTAVAEGETEYPNNYFYFNYGDDSTKWKRTGFYSYSNDENDFELYCDYLTDVKLFNLPFYYGSTGSSISNYQGTGQWRMGSYGPDSLGVDNGNYSYEVDAWGILITPYKTYKKVVRVHSQEAFDMHLYLFGSAFENDNFDDDSYFWYDADSKSFVMKFIVSTTTTGSGTQTTRYFAWQKVTPTSIEPDFTIKESDTAVFSHIDTVKFINLTSPISMCSYYWEITPSTYEFVGGTDSASINPKVVFTASGYYTVTLHASENSLGDEQITKTDYIHVSDAPRLIASFEANQTVIDLNGIVQFTNNTNYTDGTTWLWQVSPGSQGNHWDFVDFTSNTSFEPHVQFYQSGCYSIRLEATNDQFYNSPDDTVRVNYINVAGGCGDAYNVTFTITDGESGNPISGANVNVNGVGSHTTDDNGQTAFALYNGSYNYTVTASNYESTTGSFTVADEDQEISVQLTYTFIDKMDYVKIFPNPSYGKLFINGVEQGTARIYDLTGKLLFEKQLNGETQLNLSDFEHGIYLLKIFTDKGIKTEKLILK